MDSRLTGRGQLVPPARTVIETLATILRPRGPAPLPGTDGGEMPFNVVVDGVPIAVEARGQSARLTCVLADRAPEEPTLRGLMAQYFRYADRASDVLCIDPQGRLLLVADLGADEDIESFAAAFCNAAVHWQAMARRGAAERPLRVDHPPARILP